MVRIKPVLAFHNNVQSGGREGVIQPANTKIHPSSTLCFSTLRHQPSGRAEASQIEDSEAFCRRHVQVCTRCLCSQQQCVYFNNSEFRPVLQHIVKQCYVMSKI